MQAILFSHPGDFTPVCTTELGEVARRAANFEQRGVKVIGLSVDSNEQHEEWIKDINSYGSTNVQFPIVCLSDMPLFSGNLKGSFQIADTDRRISTLYDMLDEQDPTNRDAKGLPFTVSLPTSLL